MTTIVCYTGGTCGDIITAMIDNRDVAMQNGAVFLGVDRGRLKKPHSFNSTQDKDQYISQATLLYNSIPSHDLEYHVQKQHDFVGIVVDAPDTALWAAKRFKQLHRPHVWEEMQRNCGAVEIQDYAEILIHFSNLVKTKTTKLLQLERIIAGHAVHDLAHLVDTAIDAEIYKTWMQQNEL